MFNSARFPLTKLPPPKKSRVTILALFALLTMAACSSNRSQPGGHVIVDTKGVNMTHYEQDLAECQNYATEVDTKGNVAGGAVSGAVVGGLIGAAVGYSGTAKRAAGAGAVAGTARGVGKSQHSKSQVVKNCLRGRGYKVLN